MHQGIFKLIYIFNNDAYFIDFRAQKFPLIFFNYGKFFLTQQALHFGVLNYEKQHKEGTYKVLGRSVVFSAFMPFFFLLQISDYHHLKLNACIISSSLL